MRRAFGSAAVCFLAAVAPAAAQSIRGRVVLPDSTTPLAGVILVITNGAGAAATRTLTNARGEFTSGPLAPGRYSIQLLRIGYRPSAGPALDVSAGAPANVRIVFSGSPVSLAAINVRERETCRLNADSGLAVARVWEEARKAMLGSQLTDASAAPPVAEWIEYDRILDPSGRAVLEQHVRAARHPTAHAFHSLPADSLASTGYVVRDGNSTTYYAPDADALLSESFAATHCFQLQRPSAGSTLIGVGFVPASDRRDARDIAGTFWLNTNTSELESLEFRYTGLPDAVAVANAGGHVEFRRLADSNWLVSRWNVRMPQPSAADRSAVMSGIPGVPAARSGVVRAVQVTGGEVARVTRADSVVYQARGPSLVVQIAGAIDRTYPAAGAVLALDGTAYTATADAAGVVRLAPVLAGRYRARLSTPLMDSMRVPPVRGEVEAREDPHVDTLKLPPAADFVAAVCTRDSVRHGEGMLYGRVQTERARAIDGAVVTATWQSDIAVVGTNRGDASSARERSVGTFTGAGGAWRLCGVPRGTSVLVRLASDSGTDRRAVRLDSSRAFAPVDLVAHREMSSVGRDAKDALGEIPRQTALVEFRVVAVDGSAMPDVRLEVQPASGPSRTLLTGLSGRALLPDVAPGQLVVQARRIGFLPGRVSARVDAGRNTVPIILSQAALPTLDTVRVLGDRRVLGLQRGDEFETRRLNHAATASITRADIAKRDPVDLWQMLTNVSSIKVIDSAGVTAAQSTRSDQITPDLVRKSCYLTVMVDGIVKNPQGDAFDLRDLPRPDEVYGVEVFAGASTIPLQYGGAGSGKWCGMIAVWTR